jgi:single stranded DNA-binding protein
MTIECCFVGRLAQEPELKTSAAGKSWARLTLAVGYGSEDTQWVSVAVFGEAAEFICKTLHKNDKLVVEGGLRLNEWTGRGGEKRTGLSVVASRAEPPKIGHHKSKGTRQQPAANETAAASDRASALSA